MKLIIIGVLVLVIAVLFEAKIYQVRKARKVIMDWMDIMGTRVEVLSKSAEKNYQAKYNNVVYNRSQEAVERLYRSCNEMSQEITVEKEGVARRFIAKELSLGEVELRLREIEKAISKFAETVEQMEFIKPDVQPESTRTYFQQNDTFSWINSRFFSSCKSIEEVKKQYKKLAKTYHPDNKVSGNAAMFRALQEEYEMYDV